MKENENAMNFTEDDPDDIRVTVNLEDGTDIECAIMTIFEAYDQDYIVLVPVDENDEPIEEGEVFIYRYFEEEDGNPYLENIQDDEEYERVSECFDELLDEQMFDELP